MNVFRLACVPLAVGALSLGVAVVGTPAVAAITPDSNLYCSSGGDATTNSDTSSKQLATGDVDLTIDGPAPQYTAADCYGSWPGSPSAASQEADLNAIWGGGFTLLGKSDEAGAGSSLNDVDFTVTADQDEQAGSWTVSWVDNGGNLPFTIDLAALLKSSKGSATYLLENVQIPQMPTSGSGNFSVKFLNAGGKNFGELSHLSLAGKIVDTPQVPLPATFLLLGAGLLGLGFSARRWAR